MGCAMVLSWSPPFALEAGEPRSPYAHWWLSTIAQEGIGPDGERFSRALTVDPGPDVTVLKPGLFDVVPGSRQGSARLRSTDVRNDLLTDIEPLETAVPANLPSDALNRNQVGLPTLDFGARLGPGSLIVAVIDDGIPFAHERLRRADGGTRVAWTWLQGAPTALRPGGSASDLPFGRELDRREINTLISDNMRGGIVDEDTVYRDAGLVDFTRPEIQSGAFHASHGASVTDIAAGAAPGSADDIHVLAVSLPTSVTRDTSGAFVAFFVMVALKAVLGRAELMIEAARAEDGKEALDVPVVVNVSYGLTAGPKDGTALVERFIDAYVTERAERAPRIFVFPAGNHRLSRTRARTDAQQLRVATLFWRLLPDDATPSFVEIRGRPRQPRTRPSFTVEITPPLSAEPVLAPIPEAFGAYVDLVFGGEIIGRAYFFFEPEDRKNPKSPGRETVVIVVRPTVPAAPGLPFVQPGDWSLRAVPLGERPSAFPVDFFIQRDDAIPGYRRQGRQSRFNDPTYRIYDDIGRVVEDDGEDDASILRSGTLNALACGRAMLLVGGTREPGNDENAPSQQPLAYVGRGFGDDDPESFRRGPDLLAPVERSPSLRSVTTASSRSGGTTAVTGTSFAAPRAVKAIASGLLALGGEFGDSPLDTPEVALALEQAGLSRVD